MAPLLLESQVFGALVAVIPIALYPFFGHVRVRVKHHVRASTRGPLPRSRSRPRSVTNGASASIATTESRRTVAYGLRPPEVTL